MQLRYGTYSFPINGCMVTSQTQVIRSESGRPIRYKYTIHVKAYLETSSGQAACSALENALRLALLKPYQTLALLEDSGATSSLAIISNNSISGVVIVDGPHFNEAMDAEFVNRRTAEFTGEAEFMIPTASNAVISYHETVAITGNCGPVTSWRPAVNAKPVFQIVYPASTTKVTQSGRAVGHTGYPAPAALLFPQGLLKQEQSRIVRDSPRRIGPQSSALVEWPISWNYQFEANTPLLALPGTPPL